MHYRMRCMRQALAPRMQSPTAGAVRCLSKRCSSGHRRNCRISHSSSPFDSYPPDTDVLLYADFTSSNQTTTAWSCDYELDAITVGDLSDATFEEDGYAFNVDGNSGTISASGIYYKDAARFNFNSSLPWTLELIFSAAKVLDWGGGEVHTSVCRLSVGAFSTGTFDCDVVYRPSDGQIIMYHRFVTNYTGIATASPDIHIAIVRPSGTVNAGNPNRWFVNGVKVLETSSAISGSVESIDLGGFAGVVPPLEVLRVTYRQVKLTRGALYTADFTRPTDLSGPTCIDTHDASTATLREVIEQLSERAGLDAAQIDAAATDDITMPVRALAITQVSPTRSTLEQLAAAYFFETTLRDKLYFRPRAEDPLADIPFADLGAGVDTAGGEPLALAVANDLELPPQVAVSYANLLDDHQHGSEYSDRVISRQAATQTIELAIGLLPAEAKGIADAIVVDTYASRTSTSVALSLDYARLEAGDVVSVTDEDGAVYRLRFVRKREEAGLLRFDAVLDDQTALTSLQVTDDTQAPSSVVTRPGETLFEPLDIPLLRDADDGPSYYVAAKGGTTNWPGAQIQRSINNVDFVAVAEVLESAVFGTASTTLGDYTDVGFDERNSLTVNVGNGTLSSSTRAAMLEDESINAMAVGSEVIRYRDATQTAAGIYTLTGMLRGQRGTEWAMGAHGSGELCVLLRPQGLRRVASDVASFNSTRYLKGVTNGTSPASVTGEAFVHEGVSSQTAGAGRSASHECQRKHRPDLEAPHSVCVVVRRPWRVYRSARRGERAVRRGDLGLRLRDAEAVLSRPDVGRLDLHRWPANGGLGRHPCINLREGLSAVGNHRPRARAEPQRRRYRSQPRLQPAR